VEKCHDLWRISAAEKTFGLAPWGNLRLAKVFLKSNRVEVDFSTLSFASEVTIPTNVQL
jgi:hypothetical protein